MRPRRRPRQQAADWHIEDVGDDGEAGGGVDDADEEILQKAGLAGLSPEDEHRAKKPANSQDAATHQTILKALITTNAKSGPSLGVGSDGRTPAASSMTVKPPKEAN